MPSRTVLFNVKVIDKNANESVPASIEPFNDAPAQVEDIDIRSTFETLLVDFTLPEDLDFEGVLVWMDTTSGFIPSAANLVADSPGVPISVDAQADTTYYLRVAAYDAFSKNPDDLNISLERSITTLAVDTTSGAFSESLTVSGIPVSTGTSNPTFQQIYNNGSALVIPSVGKPIVVSGTNSSLVVSETGFVGVNTPVPSNFLHVGGGVFIEGNATQFNEADAGLTWEIDPGLTTAQNASLTLSDRGTEIWNFRKQSGSNNFVIRNAVEAFNPFTIEQAGGIANQLYLDSTGNVGFNTANPQERLHVVGSGIVTNKLAVGATTVSGGAVAQFTSTTGGVLFPQMTTSQRDAISNPPNGSVIYNTSTDKLQVRAAGAWADLH